MVCNGTKSQRAYAATAQAVWQDLLLKKVLDTLASARGAKHTEGIVLVGGSALNVPANQLIRDTLATMASATSGNLRGVWVPPGPNDAGLAVGGLWAVQPPPQSNVRQPLQYLGFRLWDEHTLQSQAHSRKALRLSSLGGVNYLASLLAGGPGQFRPIVAIVRGRQEFGPRALGHRSLVAVPDSRDILERMNRLKYRQWWRPVAPMIEALQQVFGRVVKAPNMEMAPRVQDEMCGRFPALCHYDGTARHQSVGELDEPWLHTLLLAVGKLTGLAGLINTSFNRKHGC